MILLLEEFANIWTKIEADLVTSLFAIVMLAIAMIANQAIGAVMAKEANQFDKDRLIKSIKKGVLITFGLLAMCFVSDLMPVLLERTNILSDEVSDGTAVVITAVQFIAIIIITIMKYMKEVYQKFLTLFEVDSKEVDDLIDPQNYVAKEKEVV